jgi:sRNA-binding protein
MMPIAQNRSHSAAVLELLCAQFPRCFFHDEARRQPLKVGIHNDVLLALGDAVTPSELARALQIYVNNRIYQSRLRPGATRIDLNGEVAPSPPERPPSQGRRRERAKNSDQHHHHRRAPRSRSCAGPGSGAGRRQIHEKARQPPHPAHHAD